MTIRKQPTDFRVDEELTTAFASSVAHDGGHVLLTLEKTSLTTPDALSMLARALKVKAGSLAYAGLKDKHARTLQHVTLPVSALGRERLQAVATSLRDRNWSASIVGFVPRPIEASDIARNHFEIIVRDLTHASNDELARRATLLCQDDSITFVNYFGEQRFGGARHGKGFAAPLLVRGDFDGALRLLLATPARKDSGNRRTVTRVLANAWGDWTPQTLASLPRTPERRAIEVLVAGGTPRDAFAALPNLTQQLCVDAFQSHIWNIAAAQLASDRSAGQTLAADDDGGVLRFPVAAAISGRAFEQLRGVSLSMPAPMSVGAPSPMVDPALQQEWDALLAQALTPFALRSEDLRIPGLRRPAFHAAPRPFLATAQAFELSNARSDDLDASGRRGMRLVRFSLPRGAYATVLLRALGQ